MNRNIFKTSIIALALCLILSINVSAQDDHTGHSGHNHQSMDMNESMSTTMDHSDYQDMNAIRETMVNNYHLVYDLIDMRERMKEMENMPHMENTHHLMVYIHSPEGNTVDKARVGFLIASPDGDQQKVMAMGMSGGFGADINLAKTGTYKISVKALFEDKDLRDSFAYEVK